MTSSDTTATTEGWGFPNGSRKAHYFRQTRSLCGKYGLYQGPLSADTGWSPDDCSPCRTKLAREAATR